MNESIMILGRQPALGLAELESLFGSEKVESIGEKVAHVKLDPCVLPFYRLGGSVKFCKHLITLDTTNWKQIEKYLVDVSPVHAQKIPKGKLTLGLSMIGFDISLKQLEATGLNIKKAIRKSGRSVRLVPNKEPELNSAQVIHNKLTDTHGWEIYLILFGDKTVIAQTVKVQDIASYTRRDRERPKRDAKVGMLPPKLAQIIINLGQGQLVDAMLPHLCYTPEDSSYPSPMMDKLLLDPFCGTGVILQEALLMGYDAYGYDKDPRMVDYTKANLRWYDSLYSVGIAPDGQLDSAWYLGVGDATNTQYEMKHIRSNFDVIATEAYLGRPFTSKPTPEILSQTISECNLIIKKFLINIHGQLAPDGRLCLAVPAWQVKPNEFKHLPLIDSLGEMGYNRVSFERVPGNNLLYYREDQIVARQLLVLTRKQRNLIAQSKPLAS